MGKRSRNKGAAFERAIAKELTLELGFSFKRNLDQYQERGLGDLTSSDPAFPFLIECKAYASGTDCSKSWEIQAHQASRGTGLYHAVIWKFDYHPVKCRVPIEAVAEAYGASAVTDKTADLYLPTFAMVAREIMAIRAMRGAQ